jgi:hypothetical protein
MRILVPKFSIDYGDYEPGSPIFFLAGPVRGGADWQQEMALLLGEAVPTCIVAIPCRWGEDHPMSAYFLRGNRVRFPRQLNWERLYLREAGIGFAPGCVVFWLKEESTEDPHPGPEPYSMDTRGEVAEWRMRMRFQNARVVIGAEDGYFGLSQIQRNYSLELGYEFPIYRTLQETADAAIRMMHKKSTPVPGGKY